MSKKEEIIDSIKQYEYGNMSIEKASNEIFDLFIVSPCYSVSLVYVKNIPNGQEIALRSFITDANSQEEALGLALIYFTNEMKNYNLSNKVVLKHN